ncbi:heavy-metal-associated domain-containing protein [Georgenia ruanii]|nr:heavy-metal-associated domain-containing protein [Georgenia ruanii]
MMMRHTPRSFVGSTTFHVPGMTDRSRADALTAAIAQITGIAAVEADPATGCVAVTTELPVDRADVAAAIDAVAATFES